MSGVIYVVEKDQNDKWIEDDQLVYNIDNRPWAKEFFSEKSARDFVVEAYRMNPSRELEVEFPEGYVGVFNGNEWSIVYY